MSVVHTEIAGPVLLRWEGTKGAPSLQNAIAKMYDHTLGAALIADAMPSSVVQQVLERLESGTHGFEKCPWPEHFRTHSLGGTLDLTGANLREHFAQAERFRVQLTQLFHGLPSFDTLVQETLQGLSGGLPVACAKGPEGQSYIPATIKLVAPNGYIPPHCELEQLPRAAYNHLRNELDCTTIVSWFLLLAPPESAGTIRVSALTWDLLDKTKMRDQRTYEAIMPVLQNYPFEDYSPSPGMMVVFDGGRYVHEVTRVQGKRTRITVGGFLARTRDHRQVLYWG